MHLTDLVLLLIHLAALVAADTEIVNFRKSQTVSRAPAVRGFSLVLAQTVPRTIISRTQVILSQLSTLQLSFQLLPRRPKAARFQQGIKSSTGYVKSRHLMYKKRMEMV